MIIPTCRRGIATDGNDGFGDSPPVKYLSKVSSYSPFDQFPLFPFGDILLQPNYTILHRHSSLLSFYAPLLESSVIVLMNYDEIKSFSFLKQYSLQELYDLYLLVKLENGFGNCTPTANSSTRRLTKLWQLFLRSRKISRHPRKT